jgi:lipopolysaccharide export system protein LptA
LAVCFGMPMLGWGEEAKPSTVITSQTMTVSSEKNQAVFRGDVKLVQEELIVQSDVMIVYFKETILPSAPSDEALSSKKGEGVKEIDKIEAKGHVRIQKGDSRATSEHAMYYKQKEIVILRGSPVAWQEGTKITGPKMIMYLKENRSVVEGGTRVVIQEGEGQ